MITGWRVLLSFTFPVVLLFSAVVLGSTTLEQDCGISLFSVRIRDFNRRVESDPMDHDVNDHVPSVVRSVERSTRRQILLDAESMRSAVLAVEKGKKGADKALEMLDQQIQAAQLNRILLLNVGEESSPEATDEINAQIKRLSPSKRARLILLERIFERWHEDPRLSPFVSSKPTIAKSFASVQAGLEKGGLPARLNEDQRTIHWGLARIATENRIEAAKAKAFQSLGKLESKLSPADKKLETRDEVAAGQTLLANEKRRQAALLAATREKARFEKAINERNIGVAVSALKAWMKLADEVRNAKFDSLETLAGVARVSLALDGESKTWVDSDLALWKRVGTQTDIPWFDLKEEFQGASSWDPEVRQAISGLVGNELLRRKKSLEAAQKRNDRLVQLYSSVFAGRKNAEPGDFAFKVNDKLTARYYTEMRVADTRLRKTKTEVEYLTDLADKVSGWTPAMESVITAVSDGVRNPDLESISSEAVKTFAKLDEALSPIDWGTERMSSIPVSKVVQEIQRHKSNQVEAESELDRVVGFQGFAAKLREARLNGAIDRFQDLVIRSGTFDDQDSIAVQIVEAAKDVFNHRNIPYRADGTSLEILPIAKLGGLNLRAFTQSGHSDNHLVLDAKRNVLEGFDAEYHNGITLMPLDEVTNLDTTEAVSEIYHEFEHFHNLDRDTRITLKTGGIPTVLKAWGRESRPDVLLSPVRFWTSHYSDQVNVSELESFHVQARVEVRRLREAILKPWEVEAHLNSIRNYAQSGEAISDHLIHLAEQAIASIANLENVTLKYAEDAEPLDRSLAQSLEKEGKKLFSVWAQVKIKDGEGEIDLPLKLLALGEDEAKPRLVRKDYLPLLRTALEEMKDISQQRSVQFGSIYRLARMNKAMSPLDRVNLVRKLEAASATPGPWHRNKKSRRI